MTQPSTQRYGRYLDDDRTMMESLNQLQFNSGEAPTHDLPSSHIHQRSPAVPIPVSTKIDPSRLNSHDESGDFSTCSNSGGGASPFALSSRQLLAPGSFPQMSLLHNGPVSRSYRGAGGDLFNGQPQTPPAPNPFPELASPQVNLMSVDRSSKVKIPVAGEVGGLYDIEFEERYKARDVCHLIVLRHHMQYDINWVLSEHIPTLGLERVVEDHELVASVFNSWPPDTDNIFYFKKNFRKYELFENPVQFFPVQMIDAGEDNEKLSENAERAKMILLQNLFSTNNRVPELQGFLYMKENSKKSWRKQFFLLRGSGLYYSTKGTSKDPKYLVCYASYSDMCIYSSTNGKKHFSSPNEFCFCLKPNRTTGPNDKHDIKCLCADSEKSRTCWIAGIRLAKYGSQLRENYQTAIRRHVKLKSLNRTTGTEKENGHDIVRSPLKSRVAMDFTGNYGKIIDNPNEAVAVAVEEGQNWRKQRARFSERSGLASGVHMSQPWFHSGTTREEACDLLQKQGIVDGLFLVRDSLSIPGAFVLSFCHNQKIRHYQICPVEQDNSVYFTLDGGQTKFTDIVQLVEFYQLNRGTLPSHLTHYCGSTSPRCLSANQNSSRAV